MEGGKAVQCKISDDGTASVHFPDGSQSTIPAELFEKSATLHDAVRGADKVFTLATPAAWLQAWLEFSCPSANLGAWDTSKLMQCLMVRRVLLLVASCRTGHALRIALVQYFSLEHRQIQLIDCSSARCACEDSFHRHL